MERGGPGRRRKEAATDVPPTSSRGERDVSADRNQLGGLIETATTSPLLHLDDRALTSIKSLVRASDSNVRAAFDFLLERLRKNHSQVRYLAVLLIDELFTRSKLFRSLLVPKFETFILLSVGFRDNYPLPPPSDRAALLRKKSLELVEKWNDMFGLHYRPLRLGYDYLKDTLRLEFLNSREVATLANQQRREREARTQDLLKRKLLNLKEDYPTLKADIQSTLGEIDQCLQILVPPVGSDAAEPTDADIVPSDESEEFESYGVQSLRHTRDTVAEEETVPHESTENLAVFDTLRDLYKLLNIKHIVNSHEWLTTLMRVEVEQDHKHFRDNLFKEVIDLRNQLLKIRGRCEALGIVRIDVSSKSADGEEIDDEIWELGDVLPIDEVPVAPGFAPQAASVEGSRSAIATSNETRVDIEEKKSTIEETRRQELMKQAPVLPWGTFLDTWGSQSAVPANNRGLEYENHWGKVDYDVVIPEDKIAEITARASYYNPPKVEIRPCLAPLRKGDLCQRRDLKKCPLHGPIVPRDEEGNIIPEEVEHTKSKPGRQGESLKGEEISGGSLSNEDDSLPDPVQLAKEAIGNVRKMDEQARASARREQAKRTRLHNEACLREAALGQARLGLGEALGGELGEGSDSRPKKPRGGLTALLREKPTVKDRLSRRLLNGRVTDATVSQQTRDQEAAYRESFPNQWTIQ